jgi:hypothetical protein
MAFGLSVVSACAVLDMPLLLPAATTTSTTTTATASGDVLMELLNYAERVREMPDADVGHELESLRAATSEVQGAGDVLRLAIVQVVAPSRFTEPREAEAILLALVDINDPASREESALAALLLDVIRYWRPSPSPPAPAAEQPTTAVASAEEIQLLRNRLAAEISRRREVEAQLRELIQLEQQITDRDTIEDE